MFMKVAAESAEACYDKVSALQGIAMNAGFSLHEDDRLSRTPVDDEVTSILDVIELPRPEKPYQTEMEKTINQVIAQCGDECIQYPRESWQCEVTSGDTRLGYWEWVVQAAKSDDVPLDQLTAIELKLANILDRLNQHDKPVKKTAMGFELGRGIFLCRQLDMSHLALRGYVTKSIDGFQITDAGRRMVERMKNIGSESAKQEEPAEPPSLHLTLNVRADDGSVVDAATLNISHQGVTDIVDHAAQLILERRRTDVDWADVAEGVLDELEEALVVYDVIPGADAPTHSPS